MKARHRDRSPLVEARADQKRLHAPRLSLRSGHEKPEAERDAVAVEKRGHPLASLDALAQRFQLLVGKAIALDPTSLPAFSSLRIKLLDLRRHCAHFLKAAASPELDTHCDLRPMVL